MKTGEFPDFFELYIVQVSTLEVEVSAASVLDVDVDVVSGAEFDGKLSKTLSL
jgi:hypothetical protein